MHNTHTVFTFNFQEKQKEKSDWKQFSYMNQ